MIIVFLGPSLPKEEATAILDAEYLPPAAQGDVYRAARRRPDAIVLVDGYFDSTPAVWHKEILWALSEGIPVFGCSSMGALRASELHTYGMVGSGVIFEWFCDGVLEDDDEVAVVHGDAASGYLQITDAMVDIRANVKAANASGALSDLGASAILAKAKATFYWDRTLRGAIRAASEGQTLALGDAQTLAKWLEANQFSRKRLDACDLLASLAQLERMPRPAVNHFTFQNSGMWADFRMIHGDVDVTAGIGPQQSVSLDDLLNELRLRPTLYKEILEGALVRLLALRQYRRDGSPPIDLDRQEKVANAFRISRTLFSESSLRHWCEANALLYPDELRAFVMDLARIEFVREANAQNVWLHVVNELRERGAFTSLHERARLKREVIDDMENIVRDGNNLDDATVSTWYFAERIQQVDGADDAMYFASIGFDSYEEFLRVIRVEYLLEHRKERTLA